MIESFLNSSTLFQITFLCYLATFICYLITFALYLSKGTKNSNIKDIMKRTATIFFTVAFIANTVLLADSWIEADRPPFRTFFESLLFATWTISLIYLVVEFSFKVRIIGILALTLIMIDFLYALSKRDVEFIVVPPALQTWIFIPHVISYFTAYAAITIAFLSAVLFLIFPKGAKGHWVMSDKKNINFSQYTYNIAKFAFLFLTLGLLLGSWWGQNAWSNYWGWDPKENWALVSWFVFISYFHLKFIKSWGEKKLSIVVIIGFFVILFTYMGMQYLPKHVQQASDHIYIE